ncbi:cyclic nucleotide-binding domain-containing protein [Fluoribacter dumoffii]|uniref:DNA-binding transcriptional dual regulator Crp n=1 Tax=Fluoribacter dumoffii TaxID=463 RepID=A0A377GCU6_9GAMM|nr:cyclic nucleotide-binding domain-containing protein [Fluoribacter dumoffii]KTC90799.1 cyclic nucleotide-binding protein [Fluoribacter dumoffii NY 23]MCW8386642.1 cyclic nucleotide-binding domain-containing protein [Fluoribacter dumoffii]MCW8419696.1 cyclic nucleotide-binding domain-containing protein [Fluoribacter dumoffii]MCW8455601.1 cyclic nucleotide-binding domain-containing protein [Fluoribacter dumoffii]MCW8460320.1 cyclic nucleotide-binding domain-containing protein [Fluoribacter dum
MFKEHLDFECMDILIMNKNSENYENLILKHPLFCLLDSQSAQQLLMYCQSEYVDAEQNIVIEGEAIDCIYFIVSGLAEVTRKIHTLEKHQVMRIAELKKGDIIGLTSEGFASQTGLQTATVKAISPTHLLKVSLYDFLQFLKQPQVKYPNLKKLSEEFLLIQYIRSHHLFKNFTHEKIQVMVRAAQNIKIPSGTCLYQEGDVAHACYYLLKGEIVLLNYKQNSSTLIKINQMFGDVEFMSETRRIDSAYVRSDSELLIIEMDMVKKFISSEPPSLFQKIISKLMRN